MAVLVFALVAVGAFVGLRGDNGGTSTKGVTGKLTLGASVSAAQAAIDSAGGQIAIGAAGGPIAGMTIDVPADAFSERKEFQVSYQPVTGSTFATLKALTPIIHIDYGGGYASEAMTVRIPVMLQPDEFAMGFYYDDATGTLQGLPLVDTGPDYVTIEAAHFSGIGLFTRAAESTLLLKKVDSGFKPGVDDWEFPNTGSYLDPAGNCNGMTLTAMWYYYRQKVANNEETLYDLYDRNGDKPGTPALWQDDSQAYRFVSVAQKYSDSSPLAKGIDKAASQIRAFDDRATYFAIAAAIEVTGGPQLLGIFRQDGGHAILAYRVDGSRIYVADPNHAGDTERYIELKDGKFQPYSGADKVGGPGYIYTRIRYDGVEALADFGMVSNYWEEFKKGAAGDTDFPAYQIALVTTKAGRESWTPLVSGASSAEATVTLGVNSDATSNIGMQLFVDGAQYLPAGANPDQFYTTFPLQLKPGPNVVGVWISGGAAGADLGYLDFQYFTLNYGAEVKITPNPASGQPDQAIKFTAEPLAGTGTPRWEWDFGDGTTVTDGGVSQSHAYKTEGSFTLKVTVYDSYDAKKAKVAASGTVLVTVTAAATVTARPSPSGPTSIAGAYQFTSFSWGDGDKALYRDGGIPAPAITSLINCEKAPSQCSLILAGGTSPNASASITGSGGGNLKVAEYGLGAQQTGTGWVLSGGTDVQGASPASYAVQYFGATITGNRVTGTFTVVGSIGTGATAKPWSERFDFEGVAK